MPRTPSYLLTVEKRIAAWSHLCVGPSLAILDIVAGTIHGERKEQVWNVATHIHFHVKSVRKFLHALGEIAIEERTKFRSFATAERLREGLTRYGYEEFASLPIDDAVLQFLYLAIRDGASYLVEEPVVPNEINRIADDFY